MQQRRWQQSGGLSGCLPVLFTIRCRATRPDDRPSLPSAGRLAAPQHGRHPLLAAGLRRSGQAVAHGAGPHASCLPTHAPQHAGGRAGAVDVWHSSLSAHLVLLSSILSYVCLVPYFCLPSPLRAAQHRAGAGAVGALRRGGRGLWRHHAGKQLGVQRLVQPTCILAQELIVFDNHHWLPGCLQEGPDHQTAFNLVMCAAAMGDAELMRQSFVQLLQVGKQVRKGQGGGTFVRFHPDCSGCTSLLSTIWHLLPAHYSFANSAGAAICG